MTWTIGDKEYDEKAILALAEEHKNQGITSGAVVIANELKKKKASKKEQ